MATGQYSTLNAVGSSSSSSVYVAAASPVSIFHILCLIIVRNVASYFRFCFLRSYMFTSVFYLVYMICSSFVIDKWVLCDILLRNWMNLYLVFNDSFFYLVFFVFYEFSVLLSTIWFLIFRIQVYLRIVSSPSYLSAFSPLFIFCLHGISLSESQ